MSGEAPRIFFSYAGEDSWWVKIFRSRFDLGVVQILDYRADSVPFGPLEQALNNQIERAAVVVAFVSMKYIKKEWTVAEWGKSLSEAQCRRLIFVPIMLEADAILWWRELRRDGKLSALSRDFQYADFTGDGSGYALPGPDNPEGIKKIAQLAGAITEELNKAGEP